MLKAIIATVVVAAITAGGVGAGLYYTGGDGGEPPTPTPTPEPTLQATPSPTPGGAGGAGGGEEGTVVPITAPFPSPPPVPADWATYTDPEGRFTFRYPSNWHFDPINRKVLSWNPATWEGHYNPPNSIGVEAHVDLEPSDTAPPPGATDTSLAGEPAWEIVRTYEATEPGMVTRSHAVGANHDGYELILVAFFAQESPDEALFLQIVNSFRFTD